MKATVANAFSEAIDAAVDTADAIAEGVGLDVERGDDFPESESEAKAASKRSLEKAERRRRRRRRRGGEGGEGGEGGVGRTGSDAEAAGDADAGGRGGRADVDATRGREFDVDAAADSRSDAAPRRADLGWHRDVRPRASSPTWTCRL